MQVVIRNYSGEGGAELFDLLEMHAADVQTQDLVRLSVGIEHVDDIIADVEQALGAA